jgi:N-acyl-L-homoserine lactone synthetase
VAWDLLPLDPPMRSLLSIRRPRPAPAPVSSLAPIAARAKAPDAALHAMQRLRYEVYCLEQRFVDAARCLDGRESDEHDLHSIHFAAATDRGEVVATLRLVLDSPLGFPLERHEPGLLDDRPHGERARTGEVSRLIIAPRYRPATIREPLILFGLFRHLYEESWRLGLVYLVAAMEGNLARLLRRLGFPFAPLGKPISYFGKVTLYGAALAAMRPGYRRILAFQRSSIGSERPSFRCFRVSSASASAGRIGDRRDQAEEVEPWLPTVPTGNVKSYPD